MDIYGKFHGLTMTAIEGNPVFEGYWRHKKALMHEKTSIVTVLIPQKELQFFRDRKPIWRKLLNYKELLRTL